MEPDDGVKKRKNKRVLIMQDLAIDGKPMGQAIDLSIEGMYISTRVRFAQNAVLTLRFEIERHPIETQARVMYRHEGIGMGVRFLSLKPEDAEQIRAHIEAVSTTRHVQPKTKRKRILIIDDTNFYQTVYQNRLLSEGFAVLIARNGMEGLKILMKEKPDLILLDLIMEGMDGYKVLQIIKSEPDLKDIPVVVFSVRGTTQEVSRAIAMGAADYLVKATTTPHQVMEKIKKVFRSGPSVSESRP
ncbi:MAG: response regulator [Nitrospirae bacterium]|nr:response regulator [Nitrospirota bacterium]